jgi:2Fe-2S ferredoxin
MAKVTFLPENRSLIGDIQDSILQTALDNDLAMDHNCGGNCACTTCAVAVSVGHCHLSPMSSEERDRLEENDRLLPDVRLGCQSRIVGDGNIVLTLLG